MPEYDEPEYEEELEDEIVWDLETIRDESGCTNFLKEYEDWKKILCDKYKFNSYEAIMEGWSSDTQYFSTSFLCLCIDFERIFENGFSADKKYESISEYITYDSTNTKIPFDPVAVKAIKFIDSNIYNYINQTLRKRAQENDQVFDDCPEENWLEMEDAFSVGSKYCILMRYALHDILMEKNPLHVDPMFTKSQSEEIILSSEQNNFINFKIYLQANYKTTYSYIQRAIQNKDKDVFEKEDCYDFQFKDKTSVRWFFYHAGKFNQWTLISRNVRWKGESISIASLKSSNNPQTEDFKYFIKPKYFKK